MLQVYIKKIRSANEYKMNEITKSMCTMLSEIVVTLINEIIPKTSRQERNEWMSEEILRIMKKRSETIRKNGNEY